MTRKVTLLKTAVALLCAIATQTLFAQDVQETQKALSLVKKNAAAIGLTDNNIINSRISDAYTDVLSGATLVYLQQTYMGYDVDKSLQVLAFKNGALASAAGKRLTIDFAKSNAAFSATQKKLATPSVSMEDAIRAAAQHLNLPSPAITQRSLANQDFSKPTDFGDLGIARDEVTSRLIWIPEKTFQQVRLVWEVNISPKKTADSWRVIVDAKAGKVLKKENYTVNDNWNKSVNKNKQVAGNANTFNNGNTFNNNTSPQKQADGKFTSATYRVVPFPVEAPSFPGGYPSLVTDPWKLSPEGSGATPFMWNDDGSRQYRFTRGNNVLAHEDVDGNNGPGERAEGTISGSNLYFDFMPDFGKPPTDSVNQGAAITNLFYWNNIMHDLSYQYGFDEPSGNFQQNNLGRGGKGYDYVLADAQDGAGLNNANFRTLPDGRKPRMQMFLFTPDPAKGFKINSPASIAGNIISVEGQVSPNNSLADVGPVTGNVALYNDVADTLHNACSDPANEGALNGKIVLLRRGTCFFVNKIKNAQNAGAIAVVVMDSIPGEAPLIMSGDDSSIVIPAVMISYEDGMMIRAVLENGATVNVTLSVPPYLDGDFDAGVICHEYTHGISNRLTGGPSNVTCLFNAEEMGEGWSDYIALMHTTDWNKAKKSDGANARPMGTYVLGEPPSGPGIRTYPYSTDMSIDPHTYADIATFPEVHYIGEIWTSILWDMTWFIIKDEGINPNIFNAWGAGGNSVAYKLVIEGMKLQPCSPGFVDGRDAILKADSLLYGGAHSCAIWKAFARRGVGVGASQGSSQIAGDETADFSESAVFITKHGPKTVTAGKEFDYTIGVKAKAVCSGTITPNYSVTDSLPANVTYVSSSGNYDASNRTVTFKNITLSSGDSMNYTITVRANKDASFPDSVYIDEPVTSPNISKKWVVKEGDNSLAWTTLDLGIYFYYSNDDSTKNKTRLVTADVYPVPGSKTTFSFFHEVANNDFYNGGVVEASTDSGKTWIDLGPYMDPAGVTYNETITGNSVLHGRKAFSGFVFGVTSIDLSAWAGKTVRLRFLYATSDGSFAVPDGGTGWIIDDILLSASPSITNTAKLYDKRDMLRGWSTVETKIKGKNLNNDFYVTKRNETEALLTWQQPGELNGTYLVERSTDNGKTFKSIGNLNTTGDNAMLQSYDFSDASPAEGINMYRIHHTSSNGTVDYSDVKAVMFEGLKAVQIYPNPAKDKISVYIPGNNKTVTVQLTDALGNQIKTYKASGEKADLNLPPLSSGSYYLNVIKADGTSKHKVIIQ